MPHPLNTHIIIDTGVVTTITLNRPQAANALNPTLMQALIEALEHIAQDQQVQLVILKAHGKSFCAGADLHWMKASIDATQAENKKDAAQLSELMHALYTLNKPTLAIVEGAAIGGGLGLLACCDIVIATPKAYFRLSEVKLGLVPAIITPYMIRAIGQGAMHYYALTGEAFSGEKALMLGLVHQLVSYDKLNEIMDELIERLLNNDASAISNTKQWIQRCAETDSPLQREAIALIAEQRSTAQAQERMRAFFNKT